MFRFAHPSILYVLLLIPLLVIFYLLMTRRKKKAIAAFGNPNLLYTLMPLLSFRRAAWKFTLILLSLFFAVIAAAGPQFGSKLQQVKKSGIELMILLDVSNSMLAQDIKPNRLEKAKMAISRMLEKLSDDKIGLIVFAGDAYVQLPITTDYSSARLFLSGINTDIVPVQGTAIGTAIDMAVKSFSSDSEASKAIIVITDGENHEDDAVSAAARAREKNIFVHTIGMGLEQGAPIPVALNSSEFIKDREGKIVMSRLDENTLKKIAESGDGLYVRANNTDVGLNTLLSEIEKMEKSLLEERVYADYAEKYHYFLGIALLLLLVEFLVLERKNKYLMRWQLFKVKSKNK